jgi:hypothetical protein
MDLEKRFRMQTNRQNVFVFFFFLMIVSGCSHSLRSVQWLEGTWEQRTSDSQSREEIWVKENRYLLSGQGTKITGQDTMLLEFLQLQYDQGKTTYTATVPDQNQGAPVPFTLVGPAGKKMIFENPDHDFPQRIIYSFNPKTRNAQQSSLTGDSLSVRVESMTGDGINFYFIKK